jgi:hypothetical protein
MVLSRLIRVRLRALACACALLAPATPALAQFNDPAYANHFLFGRFGEVCTMCEIMVLCEAGGSAPPAHATVPAVGSFTLYHIHTRTFWSQVSTIWEWFIANFSGERLAAGHARPVTLHVVEDGRWAPPTTADLHIALEPPLIKLPDGREIERVERRWRQSDTGTDLGFCQRLPLWESLAVIEQHSGGTPR